MTKKKERKGGHNAIQTSKNLLDIWRENNEQ